MGGLPSQRVKCHLIKGLMNELRAKVFGGRCKEEAMPAGRRWIAPGAWSKGTYSLHPHHVGG